jgi:putative endonuclease
MYYVYLLKSQSRPKQPYIGSTRDLRRRLKEHNEGRSPHTAKFRPWILIAYFAFSEEGAAIASRITLSQVQGAPSSNGISFSKNHLITWEIHAGRITRFTFYASMAQTH